MLFRSTETVVFNGRQWSGEKLRNQLERDLIGCKRCTEELKARESLLEAKEQSLEAAREQLANMKSQKEQLEVQIAQVEAQLKTLRVAQAKSNFQLDDTRLSHLKSALADVRSQMKIQQTEAVLVAAWESDTITSETEKAKTVSQLAKEVEDFLSTSDQSVETPRNGKVASKR